MAVTWATAVWWAATTAGHPPAPPSLLSARAAAHWGVQMGVTWAIQALGGRVQV